MKYQPFMGKLKGDGIGLRIKTGDHGGSENDGFEHGALFEKREKWQTGGLKIEL